MTPSQERTYQLLNTITLMDKRIDLCQQRMDLVKQQRELYRQELIKRFPDLEKDEEFKEKKL